MHDQRAHQRIAALEAKLALLMPLLEMWASPPLNITQDETGVTLTLDPPDDQARVVKIYDGILVNGKYDATLQDRNFVGQEWIDSIKTPANQIWAIDLSGSSSLGPGAEYPAVWSRKDEVGGPFFLRVTSGSAKALTDASYWLELTGDPATAEAWDAATAYVAGDLAVVAGSAYACILGHTNHTPPNVTYWVLVATYRGGYQAGYSYAQGDYVQEVRTLWAFQSCGCGCGGGGSTGQQCYATPGISNTGSDGALEIMNDTGVVQGSDANSKIGTASFAPGRTLPTITRLKFSKSTGSGLTSADFGVALRGDPTMSTYLLATVTYTDSGTTGQLFLTSQDGGIDFSTTFTLSFSVDEEITLLVTDDGATVTTQCYQGASLLKTLTTSTSLYTANTGFQGLYLRGWPSNAFYLVSLTITGNGQTVWYDTFEDTDQTLLSAHSPIVGCGKFPKITSGDSTIDIDITTDPGIIDISTGTSTSGTRTVSLDINKAISDLGLGMTNLTWLPGTPTIVSGTTYSGTLYLILDNDTPAEGAKIDFDGGAATFSAFRVAATYVLDGTATLGVTTSSAAGTDLTLTSVGPGDVLVGVNFVMTCSGDDSFIPRVGQNSGGTGTLTVKIGTYMTLG